MYSEIKYRSFQLLRTFGVELEVSNTVPKYKIKNAIKAVSKWPVKTLGWGYSVDNSEWEIKDDSTCGPAGASGPKGYEIASFVGSCKDQLQHIADVADHLRKKKVEVTDFCGLHIHAWAGGLSVEQVAVIAAYWMKMETFLSMVVPPRRRSNEFCRHLGQKAKWHINRTQRHEAGAFWDLIKPEDLSPFDNQDRRATLNLVNFARGIWYPLGHRRKTLELRWPEGTLNGRNVLNWTRLFLHFIETCKDRSMPDDLLQADMPQALAYLGLHHENNCFYILSEELMEVKTWLLERLIREMEFNGAYWYGSTTARRQTRHATDLLNQMWSPLKKYA